MQEKMGASMKEEIKVSKEETKEEMRAWRKEMKARWEAMMEVCLEIIEATEVEANPEEIDSELEHQEVPKEMWCWVWSFITLKCSVDS